MITRAFASFLLVPLALVTACDSPEAEAMAAAEDEEAEVAEQHAATVLPGEHMMLAAGHGGAFSQAGAFGGQALLIWSNATAWGSLGSPWGASGLRVRARAELCDGPAAIVVRVDGVQRLTRLVDTSTWKDYSMDFPISPGSHSIEVDFLNDTNTPCDRNLWVDEVRFYDGAWAPPQPYTANPFEGATLYVNPFNTARQQADEWRVSRPDDAAQMDKIATAPTAAWFGDWSGDIESSVRAYVDMVSAQGALPVLVAYNIPGRDCGSHSRGGAKSHQAYRDWIDDFAAGIGYRNAVVILEPDAISLADCLDTFGRQTRFSLLSEAVQRLQSSGTVAVYIDAGHSGWHPAQEAATRLWLAGVAHARGFALNVSNTRATGDELAYGTAVGEWLGGGKPFVIDTGRNGLGSNGEWCNPAGRALGVRPSTATGWNQVHAYLWVKPPGESDGACNGGPPAGAWWPEYALGLAQRAAY